MKVCGRKALVAFLLFSVHVAGYAEIYVDYPEIVNEKKYVGLNESSKNGRVENDSSSDWVLVSSHIPHGNSFVSVFKGGERVWKSPPMASYWGVSSGVYFEDVDGDPGTVDVVWQAGLAHNACSNFGIIVSIDSGKKNYLFHYNSYDVGVGLAKKVILQSSKRLSDKLADFIRKSLAEGCLRTDEGMVEQLLSHQYVVLEPQAKAISILKDRYMESLGLYKKGSKKSALELLERVFESYDYREIDSNNKNSEYTSILNDYGFF